MLPEKIPFTESTRLNAITINLKVINYNLGRRGDNFCRKKKRDRG
jgi:hypothetical protein